MKTFLTISLGLLLLLPDQSMGGAIYWTDRASGAKAIRKMGLNGTNATTLITLATSADPRGIAVDSSAEKLYYASTTQIIQANLDGTGSVAKISGQSAVRDLRLDVPTGFLYWADQTAGRIQRALISNFVVTGSYAKVATDCYFLDLYRGPGDYTDAMILWGDSGSSFWLTGTDPSWLTPNFSWTGGQNVRGVAVDGPNQTIYWCEKDAKMVRRAKLKANLEIDSGTTQNLYTGLNAPHGLVLDLHAKKLYWVDSGTNGSTGFGRSGVNRGDMDGTGAAEALFGPSSITYPLAGQPWDLDLDKSTINYDEWKARYFRTDTSSLQTAVNADPDGDGLVNWAEYALGGAPLAADRAPLTAQSVNVAGTTYPAISFLRRIGSTDISYFPQVSATLHDWLDNIHTPSAVLVPVTVEVSATPMGDGLELATVRSTSPLHSLNRQFMRVLVENK
jgi:hypothetical protein